jgi:hypothetical protein
MATIFQVTPPSGSVLLPDGLGSVVRILEPMQRDLAFRVFEFDGVMKDSTRMPFEFATKTASGDPDGLELSWDGLVNLAEDIFDVWDLLLVGYGKEGQPPGRRTFEELASANEVVLEVFDSSSVRVAVKSAVLAQRVKAVFPLARTIDTWLAS